MTKDEAVTVSREGLLRALQSLRPGLSAKGDLVDSVSTYAFRGGRAYAYNGEVLCRCKSTLPKDFEGTVPAGELVEILGRVPYEDVDLSWSDKALTIRARRLKVDLPLDKSFDVPVGDLPKPEGYEPLPADFPDAVEVVKASAGDSQEAPFAFKCVHLAPDFMESSDQFRLARYHLKLPITKRYLVIADRFKELGPLGMTEMAESDGWLHFRNPAGVVASVRTQDVEYPDLGGMVAFRGDRMSLPKGLLASSKVAEAVLGNRKDDLTVYLSEGEMKVVAAGGRGASMVERRKVAYKGKPLRWSIRPAVLAEVAAISPECEVGERFLKIDAGRFVFVASVAAEGPKASADGRADDGDED